MSESDGMGDNPVVKGSEDEDVVISDSMRLFAARSLLADARDALVCTQKQPGISESVLRERVERNLAEVVHIQYCVANPDKSRIARQMWAEMTMIISSCEPR